MLMPVSGALAMLVIEVLLTLEVWLSPVTGAMSEAFLILVIEVLLRLAIPASIGVHELAWR